jgi:hypothetical protein
MLTLLFDREIIVLARIVNRHGKHFFHDSLYLRNPIAFRELHLSLLANHVIQFGRQFPRRDLAHAMQLGE